MNRFYYLCILLFLPVLTGSADNLYISSIICTSYNEEELAGLINSYRLDHGLNPISISVSLTAVAQLHVKDLFQNTPYDDSGKCNMHSWSKAGKNWTACCYNSGEDGECMWNKPRELSSYQGDGYEIVMAQFNSQFPEKEVSAADALEAWKESPRHNAVLLNKDIWKSTDYKAMGVGMYKGFAAVWFGEQVDTAGNPKSCSN